MSDDEIRIPTVSDSYPAVTEDSGLQTKDDDVFVVLTQAFDGYGNSLIRPDNPEFDSFPGVSLWLELPNGRGGVVTLSPIHGDVRRLGMTDVDDGTPCKLHGVKGGPQLDEAVPCGCGGTYHRIYLSPKRDRGEIVLVCNVWGCYRSRIIDASELLSWIDY